VRAAALVLALAATLAAGAGSAAPRDTLTDAQIKAFAAKPFDRRTKMFKHDDLGVHHGVHVVVDYPCSDVCPNYTTRIIHYAVDAGPACDRIHGAAVSLQVPMSIATVPRTYCVPKVLTEQPAGVGKPIIPF
jgi:hypothetical protein